MTEVCIDNLSTVFEMINYLEEGEEDFAILRPCGDILRPKVLFFFF